MNKMFIRSIQWNTTEAVRRKNYQCPIPNRENTDQKLKTLYLYGSINTNCPEKRDLYGQKQISGGPGVEIQCKLVTFSPGNNVSFDENSMPQSTLKTPKCILKNGCVADTRTGGKF
jgi:hypothetical protein